MTTGVQILPRAPCVDRPIADCISDLSCYVSSEIRGAGPRDTDECVLLKYCLHKAPAGDMRNKRVCYRSYFSDVREICTIVWQ